MHFNYRDKRVVPVLCFSLLLGCIVFLNALWGHIQVYILQNASVTQATVQHTYTSRPNTTNQTKTQYVSYTFMVGNICYEGIDRSAKHYPSGSDVTIYYSGKNPEKNGLLKIDIIVLGISIIIICFSLWGIIDFLKQKIKGI